MVITICLKLYTLTTYFLKKHNLIRCGSYQNNNILTIKLQDISSEILGYLSLKGMSPYIRTKFRIVTKIRNSACDHDVGM